jgi:acetyl-CoA C-acetyltransferase
VLICGAEAFYGPQAAGLTGRVAVETIDSDKKADQHLVGDLRTPLTPIEMSYGLGLPVVIYAFFENALRAHWGKSPPDHIQEIAEFCARMSEIAVHNPYAWSRKARSAAEIATVTPDNRRIVYPYTKLMCSNIAVNQAAALLMTNLAVAQSSGIPHERIVFLRGCGDAEDNFYFSERPELWSSPSVADAVNAALGQASLQLDDIEFLDFYSCFPVAPRIAREELKIDPRDPRDLTITGGMPYFGGPGNNYALHTVCTMVQKLRERPQSLGSCRH